MFALLLVLPAWSLFRRLRRRRRARSVLSCAAALPTLHFNLPLSHTQPPHLCASHALPPILHPLGFLSIRVTYILTAAFSKDALESVLSEDNPTRRPVPAQGESATLPDGSQPRGPLRLAPRRLGDRPRIRLQARAPRQTRIALAPELSAFGSGSPCRASPGLGQASPAFPLATSINAIYPFKSTTISSGAPTSPPFHSPHSRRSPPSSRSTRSPRACAIPLLADPGLRRRPPPRFGHHYAASAAAAASGVGRSDGSLGRPGGDSGLEAGGNPGSLEMFSEAEEREYGGAGDSHGGGRPSPKPASPAFLPTTTDDDELSVFVQAIERRVMLGGGGAGCGSRSENGRPTEREGEWRGKEAAMAQIGSDDTMVEHEDAEAEVAPPRFYARPARNATLQVACSVCSDDDTLVWLPYLGPSLVVCHVFITIIVLGWFQLPGLCWFAIPFLILSFLRVTLLLFNLLKRTYLRSQPPPSAIFPRSSRASKLEITTKPQLTPHGTQHSPPSHQHPQTTCKKQNPMAVIPGKRVLPARASPTNHDARNLHSASQNAIGGNAEDMIRKPQLMPEDTHQFLLARRLLPERQVITYYNLATALLHLAEVQSTIPKTTQEGIKAISTLLIDLADRTTTSEIATIIRERLSGVNDILAPVIQQIESATQTICDSTGSLAGTVEELQQESDGTTQRIVEAVAAQILADPNHSVDKLTGTPSPTTRYPSYVMNHQSG
ncbi:hypothetical protein JB92DRAFT_3132759 [Gautieria morchelliformis]|nr:hypothetical protein JB92DRAFT_3132759 [Gautieria morchelliformis]